MTVRNRTSLARESAIIASLRRARAGLDRAALPGSDDRAVAFANTVADRAYQHRPTTLPGVLALLDLVIRSDGANLDAPVALALANVREGLRTIIAGEAAEAA